MNKKMRRFASVASVSFAAAVSLSACASHQEGLNTWQPKTDPVRPNTPFTHALACMKGQLNVAGGAPITVSVGNIPDATGRVSPGMRDMVTSALSDVISGTKAFKLTEVGSYGLLLGPTIGARQDIAGSMLGIGGVRVSGGYQLVGAMTQADNANVDNSLSAGISHIDSHGHDDTADAAITNTVSTMAIDLRLVDVSNGLNIPYATRSLLRVKTSGLSANVNFTIGDVGSNIGYDSTTAEGAHQAARELIELSVAELMGKAAHTPYWTCLGTSGDDPQVMSMVQGWYTRMSDSQTDTDMRARLRTAGYDVPVEPKSANAAILKYQYDNGLVPTGKPSFETFLHLVMRQVPHDMPVDHLPDVTDPMDGAMAKAAVMAPAPAPAPAAAAAPSAAVGGAPVPSFTAPVAPETPPAATGKYQGASPDWCSEPARTATEIASHAYYCH